MMRKIFSNLDSIPVSTLLTFNAPCIIRTLFIDEPIAVAGHYGIFNFYFPNGETMYFQKTSDRLKFNLNLTINQTGLIYLNVDSTFIFNYISCYVICDIL